MAVASPEMMWRWRSCRRGLLLHRKSRKNSGRRSIGLTCEAQGDGWRRGEFTVLIPQSHEGGGHQQEGLWTLCVDDNEEGERWLLRPHLAPVPQEDERLHQGAAERGLQHGIVVLEQLGYLLVEVLCLLRVAA